MQLIRRTRVGGGSRVDSLELVSFCWINRIFCGFHCSLITSEKKPNINQYKIILQQRESTISENSKCGYNKPACLSLASKTALKELIVIKMSGGDELTAAGIFSNPLFKIVKKPHAEVIWLSYCLIAR